MVVARDWVEVKPAVEILETLDPDGLLDGLPFMPEMLPFCGRRFRVAMRAERTCVYPPEIPFRRLGGSVVLEGLRCDGSAHGGCQLGCMILWKEAWLTTVRGDVAQPVVDQGRPLEGLRVLKEPNVYVCQATELVAATVPGEAIWRPSQYVGYLRARTYTPRELVGLFGRPLLRRAERLLASVSRRGAPRTAPDAGALGLRPGEWVEVRSREEIEQTLDAKGTHTGLWFGGEMYALCGMRMRVARRVDRIIQESTGRIRPVRDTVMLDGAVCDRYFACARGMPFMWREVWLKRTEPDRIR